jgi:hypothetical protein
MEVARVFLDTSAVKHSFRAKHVLRPRLKQIECNGTVLEVLVHDFVTVDPAARVDNPKLRAEIDLLSEIANLARAKSIELLWHHEANIEFGSVWLVPSGGRPELLEAGVTWVESPIPYSRIPHPLHFGTEQTWRDVRVDFLKEIRHERYLQLQKACGADQGTHVNSNQLIDAFHIWCAESAGATHFLTTDLSLVRLVTRHRTYPLVSRSSRHRSFWIACIAPRSARPVHNP